MPHCPPALISSSASTTSSAPKCRASPGAWCPTALQPLFLRRGAPRPPPQNADRPRGRGASLPSSPYFFVEAHHVLHSKVPGIPGGVVPHSPLSLVPSSAGTTSSASKCRAAPGTWCLTVLQPLFLRRQAPRPAPLSSDRPRDVVPHCPPALIPSSRSTTSSTPKCRASPGAWCLTALQPLFLRPQAPRPPLRSAGQPRGRGASFPAIPCSFVRRHHVRRLKHSTVLRMRPDVAKSRFFSINVY